MSSIVTPKQRHIRNVNKEHEASLKLNDKIALFITKQVGSMPCAYIFACLAIYGATGVDWHNAFQIVAWISQTFLQLVLLSIIMVGQNLQSRHSELRADNDYEINVKAEQEVEGILRHLEAQNEVLIALAHKSGLTEGELLKRLPKGEA